MKRNLSAFENHRKLVPLIFALMVGFGLGSAHGQMVIAKPQSSGGNPVGIWEASQELLKVYVPAQVITALSGFELGGDLSGTLTLDDQGNYQADYIITAKVTVSFLGLPIQIDVADTNRRQGTYSVSGSQLTFTPNDVSVSPDTLGFTATVDSLHLVQRVPLQGFESLAAGIVPADDPIVGVLSFVKTGTPPSTTEPPPAHSGPITADFDASGVVDFTDFIAFVSHFGSQSGDAVYDVTFDLNLNGAVDFADFLSFAAQFGSSSGS